MNLTCFQNVCFQLHGLVKIYQNPALNGETTNTLSIKLEVRMQNVLVMLGSHMVKYISIRLGSRVVLSTVHGKPLQRYHMLHGDSDFSLCL